MPWCLSRTGSLSTNLCVCQQLYIRQKCRNIPGLGVHDGCFMRVMRAKQQICRDTRKYVGKRHVGIFQTPLVIKLLLGHAHVCEALLRRRVTVLGGRGMPCGASRSWSFADQCAPKPELGCEDSKPYGLRGGRTFLRFSPNAALGGQRPHPCQPRATPWERHPTTSKP